MTPTAALTITVCPQGEGHRGRLLLIERAGHAASFGAIPRAAWLNRGRARLADQLYEIRRGLGDAPGALDVATGGEALRQIFSLGLRWMADLLGSDSARTHELTRFMRGLVPDWGRRGPGLRVEIRHSDEGAELSAAIPFELLPLFDFGELPPLTTKPALTSAAFRFPGMVGVVARQPRSAVPDHLGLRRNPASGRVPVQAYCDWSLPGVADEVAALREMEDDFELAGGSVWPREDGMTSQSGARDLVQRLFGTNASSDCHIPIQIHHFACHYGIPDWDPSDECFTFSAMPAAGGEAGGRFIVQRGLLKEKFIQLADARGLDHWNGAGPVAVLNACDSASLRLADEEPLVWWLLGAGYRAVLGAETRIPDQAAARFSRFVYGHLSAGKSLGEAVRSARWDMLEKLNSPAGLFFTLHGRPELFLEDAAGPVQTATAPITVMETAG
jgi:hypothetical protein